MALDDLAGFKELAFEFFNDTRRNMTVWRALVERGDAVELRAHLHRCKGGASIFGFERLHNIIAQWETSPGPDPKHFDLDGFERELDAAEMAVLALEDDHAIDTDRNG